MSVTAANHTQNFTNTLSNNVKLGATMEGTVTTLAGVVNYTVKDTTVKSVDLSNWNGRSSAVASGWKSVDGGLTVTAAGFTDPKLAAGQTYLDIVTTDTEGFFGSVTGDKAYLNQAYKIANDNVTVLLQGQRDLNDTYKADVVEVTIEEPDYRFMSEKQKKEKEEEYCSGPDRLESGRRYCSGYGWNGSARRYGGRRQ